MENQKITLTVNGQDLHFEVELDSYNKYLNDLTPSNKIAPAKNFIMRSVTSESKEGARAIIELPSGALQLAGALVDKYTPDIEIVVGK